MDDDDIPRNPFRAFTASDTRPNCTNFVTTNTATETFYHLPQLNAQLLNESCTQTGTYDYFYNSEVSYILTFVFLGACILGKIIIINEK